jgi:hypothetical protein
LILEPELKAETPENIFFDEKKCRITNFSYIFLCMITTWATFCLIPKSVTLITSSEPNVFQSVQNEKKIVKVILGELKRGGGGEEGQK